MAEVETTDHKYLCMDCAQNSHTPCDCCGLVVPGHEVSEDGTCIDCREKEATRLAVHGNTRKVRRKACRWQTLLAAENVALSLLEEGVPTKGGVQLRDLLSGLRANEPKFS